MNSFAMIGRWGSDFLYAMQFLTRVPMGHLQHQEDSLARAVKFFPLVGLLVGAIAALFHRALVPHLPGPLTALLVIIFLVLMTGCLHEDGLSDAADGFGGGWNRDQILTIMRDSRIGSYGAAALVLSLVGRLLLISYLPLVHVTQYLISAHVLCRWTTLPLSFYLPAARVEASDGQGARIARMTSKSSLIAGTLIAFVIVAVTLRGLSIVAIGAAIAVTLFSGLYYRSRIGGITGDCFGATNQLTEIAIYLCGAWTV